MLDNRSRDFWYEVEQMKSRPNNASVSAVINGVMDPGEFTDLFGNKYEHLYSYESHNKYKSEILSVQHSEIGTQCLPV